MWMRIAIGTKWRKDGVIGSGSRQEEEEQSVVRKKEEQIERRRDGLEKPSLSSLSLFTDCWESNPTEFFASVASHVDCFSSRSSATPRLPDLWTL